MSIKFNNISYNIDLQHATSANFSNAETSRYAAMISRFKKPFSLGVFPWIVTINLREFLYAMQ